ncbi:hypothetical protein [Rhodococcus qingshengii]|uniref:hypothetical protein n=1 Tax=Rhodococcus qingshengii TaxID=334542 RepID=UPI0024BA416F|nr:hypothetical protein [Rhodococcus qingshengii]MDJ0441434.1 hypothetical protein [Rhodococcus qingshengii]
MSEALNDARRTLKAEATPAASVAIARRIPGKAKAQTEALRDYEAFNAKRRERIPVALWPFWAPGPDTLYRWRVRLTCGCVHEVLTHGNDAFPAEGRWPDPVHRSYLPPGQMWCRHDESANEQYQSVVEWGARGERTFPADPMEPLYDLDVETWMKIRHDEPRTSALWTVTLAYGHATEMFSDLDWQPLDGPKRVSAERQREMIAEFEQLWATDPGSDSDREREHMGRQLAEGWPRPATEQLCYTCPQARAIVVYQGVDWLVPRKKVEKADTGSRPSRKQIEQRLAKAQAEQKRLEEQLAELDQQDRSAE